jgi:hypothetical protein
MIRPIIIAFVLFVNLGIESLQAQQPSTFKKFASFKGIVADVDFFASNRQIIAPYEKPAAESISRLKSLLGTKLPKGAIFICSTLEQKDSIYEPMVLKMGYTWLLIANTPDVRVQEVMARMKAQMGGDIPAEIKDRLKSRLPEMTADMEKQMVSTVTEQIAYAVLQTMLEPDLKYRSSRVEDVSKSPLPDWIDIGIASYASGTPANVQYLQQHLDQTFPMEDVIAMSRPFVASSSSDQGGGNRGGNSGQGGSGQGGSGQGMQQGGFSGRGMGGNIPAGNFPGGGGGFPGGGFPGGGQNANGGGRGGNNRNMSKDEQDRAVFDGQASTLFSYLIEKVGIEKVKELVKQSVDGKESREFISRPDVLGSDFSKIEEDWTSWVKNMKAPQNQRPGPPGQF